MTVVVVVSWSGLKTAMLLADHLKCEIHGRFSECDLIVDDFKAHLNDLFKDKATIVFVGALGILIRLLASSIREKSAEGAVVVVAEDGTSVIPTLGGHDGANELSLKLADLLGIRAATTTASDLHYNVALDTPPKQFHLANKRDYKSFMSKLLSGDEVSLQGYLPWLTSSDLPINHSGKLKICSSHFAEEGSSSRLIYNYECLALGVGCERGTSVDEVITLVQNTIEANKISKESIAVVASIEQKMDETAINAVAEFFNRPIRFFDPDTLEKETPRLKNPSNIVFKEVGCHGVAEGSALAAAGADSELIIEKTKSRRATCAIAKSKTIIDPTFIGQPRGTLIVVGLGPGKTEWLTPEAKNHIEAASDIVGYSLYLDLLGELTNDKTTHAFNLGEEQQRAIAALNLASKGKIVALVSSGDPGIYAMASLVFDCVSHSDDIRWKRIEIIVSPGISALQACAALVGAPIGHDFCAISLSDLLTPWAVIEKRLRKACEGDFVIALYNPTSQKRAKNFQTALDLLKEYYEPATPVAIGKSIGRPAEKLITTNLINLDKEEIDMLSIIIIGNSQTKIIDGKMFTPRGYLSVSSKNRAALK